MPIWMGLLLAAAAALALLTGLVLRSPHRLSVKLLALAVPALFLPLLWLATGEILGRAKPVQLEWWRARVESVTVIASHLREGEGIYLWLLLPGGEEPRAYVLPWRQQLAEDLVEASREARENGTAVIMRLPFEPSLDDRPPVFHALPQPALPPKEWRLPPPPFSAPDAPA